MSLTEMFRNMGFVAWTVVITLFVLSIYSFAVMIEKWRLYGASRKQSLEFLPIFVRQLKENKLKEAVDTSRKYNKSHLAKVVSAGLLEYLNDEAEIESSHDLVDACGRALERAIALTTAEMKKGLGGLATIGSTAPFIGLFGTVMGIVNAFAGMSAAGSGGISAIAAGIAEALITTAFGLLVAIPAVMAFNYFSTRLERFQIEMSNSSAELMDFFLKKHEAAHAKSR
jgi:biopolymer transport protein ExbB/biopolymer transport protein TolQ